MNAAKRIGLFVAGLAVIFAAAVAIGSLVDPTETETDQQHEEETMSTTTAPTTDHGAHGAHAVHDTHGAAHGAPQGEQEPAGLGVSEGGYTLRMSPTRLGKGEARELRFSIEGADGPVTEFDELHERRMHLIVVRRDGAQFRHLHPEMDVAGTWTIPIEFSQAGVYRAFADFSVGGEQHTLASDVNVSGGEFEPEPFPPAKPLDSTGGYEVRLRAGEPRAGEPASLSFDVSRDGQAVEDLAPYLGAKGHLVALREGDLAFLHVHPEEAGGGHAHGHGAHGGAAEEIAFAVTFPTAGRYRLYLQFKHEGTVRTVEYTVVVPR
jgi:hypothetical protein